MAIQDLTPQLRTRLSRVERIVGIFILGASLMMLAGLVFFLRQTADRKGWFVLKAPYYTYLRSGEGIHTGDKVKMMGFDVGEITLVTADPPESTNNVYIEFVVQKEFPGYIWSDSKVSVKSAGLLGSRYLEVIKGDASGAHGKVYPTYKTSKDQSVIQEILVLGSPGTYVPFEASKKPKFFLEAEEPPLLSSEIDGIVKRAKEALPHVLALTNQLTRVMSNTAEATERLNILLNDVRPVVANLAVISTNLKEPKGALGEWLIPTNMHHQLNQALISANETLGAAQSALTNANTQMTVIATSLDQSLDQLAGITGNLRRQVDQNTNLVSDVSTLIVNTDNLVQGLKRHWMLRSAFRTNASPTSSSAPIRPRGRNP